MPCLYRVLLVDQTAAVLERIDHSAWLRDSIVVFMHDENDRSALGTKLLGAESIFRELRAPYNLARCRLSLGQLFLQESASRLTHMGEHVGPMLRRKNTEEAELVAWLIERVEQTDSCNFAMRVVQLFVFQLF